MESRKLLNEIFEWDKRVIIKYNGIGGRYFRFFLKFISFFGRETLWLFLTAFFLFIWYDPFLFSYFSTTFLIGVILILATKKITNRARPFETLKNGEIIVFGRRPTSRSFPSWHSYNVVSQGLLMGVYLLQSPLLTILFLLSAILISFSRVQLGVHYPTDVIFGYFFGVIGFILSIYLFSPVILHIITYLEQFMVHEIQYYQFNSMLYENPWYFILCLFTFFIIFILAIYKSIKKLEIKQYLKRKVKKDR